MSSRAVDPSQQVRAVRPLAPRSGAVLARAAAPGLAVSALASIGVWCVWRVFVAGATGQRVDEAVLTGAGYGRTRLWRLAEPVLEVVSVPYIALVLVLAVVIAVARRRWALAVQVALLMGGANLTTQVLKYLVLDRPDLGIGYASANTLPSGHTTAAASVSAALVFVVPPRGRPWAAVLGAVYTTATGVSTLIGRWHRPSDVVAAVLVVLAWSGLACALAALTRPGRRGAEVATSTAEFARPDGTRRPRSTGLGAGLLALAGLAAALPAAYALRDSWTTAGELDSRAELLVAYAGGAFGVMAACCLAFAVLLVVRQRAGQAV